MLMKEVWSGGTRGTLVWYNMYKLVSYNVWFPWLALQKRERTSPLPYRSNAHQPRRRCFQRGDQRPHESYSLPIWLKHKPVRVRVRACVHASCVFTTCHSNE